MYSSQLLKKTDFLWNRYCRARDNLLSDAFLPWGWVGERFFSSSCLCPHSHLESALYFYRHVVFCTCQITVSLSLTGKVQFSGDLCIAALAGMFIKLVHLGFSSFLWLRSRTRQRFMTHIPWCAQWHYVESHRGGVWPVQKNMCLETSKRCLGYLCPNILGPLLPKLCIWPLRL